MSYVDSPWFHVDFDAIRIPGVWRAYLNAVREEPGGILERALESYEWRQRVVTPIVYLMEPERLCNDGTWMKWRP